MIGYASQTHYRHHLEPLGIEITDRRPTNHSHVVVASRRDARYMAAVRTAQVAVVEHGAGQRYHIDAGGPEEPHSNVSLFLAPSQRVARHSAHLFPRAECVAVGSPRVEYLASLPRQPSRVVVSFHWNSPVAPEAQSAWQHYQRMLPLLNDFDLVGHAHPAIRSKLKPWYQRAGIEWREDWADCVSCAAALVVDNSSIMWEACALGIPVVVLNAPWYRRDVKFGLRFWSKADIGPHVEYPSQVADAIDAVLHRDRWQLRRRRAAEYVYGDINGATARARDALTEWAAEA